MRGTDVARKMRCVMLVVDADCDSRRSVCESRSCGLVMSLAVHKLCDLMSSECAVRAVRGVM